MRNTLRAALFTAGLLAVSLPMAAHAAGAPHSTKVQHAAAEKANATAIAGNRLAFVAKRNAANRANDAAQAKSGRPHGTTTSAPHGKKG